MVQLKAEVSRLKADLERVNEECDILKKAATYFAKLGHCSTLVDSELR
jgi:transposase